jgi:hypothetical protein
MKVNIGGVLKDLSAYQAKVGGVLKEVTGGYANKGGVLYPLAMSKGTPIGELSVGDIVKMNVNGVSTDFIVVHQGNPDSSLYDGSCDGTWLLMKDIYAEVAWDETLNKYADSGVHTYLNGTFIGLIDTDIQSVIKQIKIPYQVGGGDYTIKTGASGLSTKVFLLGASEFYPRITINDSKILDYFKDDSDGSKAIAYFEGTVLCWWARTPSNPKNVYFCARGGGTGNAKPYVVYGVRPAMILQSDTAFVDSDFNIVV